MRTLLHLFTEEGRTRTRNAFSRYVLGAIIACAIGCVVLILIYKYWTPGNLTPLQRCYFREYEYSNRWRHWPASKANYEILSATVTDPRTKQDQRLDLTENDVEPVLDEEGNLTVDSHKHGIFRAKIKVKELYWSAQTLRNDRAYIWLRSKIFHEQTVIDLYRPAWRLVILFSVLGSFAYPIFDMFVQHDHLKGQTIRGTRKLSPREYERQHRKHTGYGFIVYSAEATRWVILALLRLAALAGFAAPTYRLGVPRNEETHGLLVLGDPGTGKSQIFHRLIRMIRRRSPAEALVCYDPEGEFVKKHLTSKGSIILNPFDSRFSFWSPAFEVNYKNPAARAADLKMIAECFFPARLHGAANSEFFINAARLLFARILEVEQDLPRIIEILIREDLIDQIVAGTELAHLIAPGAKGQRGGVLATLAEIGESLKLLPLRAQCQGVFSLTQWARKREGSIFITSKHDTRDALGRLQAAWLNILMKRLLSADTEWSNENPCWVIVDEVHALKHLSALPEVIVEGRKHGLKIAIGTQNKAQLEEHYGRNAATMLASFQTKIIFRCNEPECARWLSDLIGEDETEERRVNTTASATRHGRDSVNYNMVIERRAVVSKEEIMSLPNLHGYWRYGNVVVPFRIHPLVLENVAHSFVERKSPPAVSLMSPPVQIKLPHENGKETREIAAATLEDIDISF